MLTIGLFGTCGGSKWRDPFIAEYERIGIRYFNPQVDNWTPEMAVQEAEHLANDEIILFPVTAETTGLGSLSEVGFSILNAIKLDDRRDFIILIEQGLIDAIDDLKLRKELLRARALVLQHLKKLALGNVYLVTTLDEMLEVSLALHAAAKLREPFKSYALKPHSL